MVNFYNRLFVILIVDCAEFHQGLRSEKIAFTVSMLHNIAAPDKAKDKCHNLFNPFKANGISHFYQKDQSIFVGVVFHSYSNFIRTSCKQTVESLITALCGV